MDNYYLEPEDSDTEREEYLQDSETELRIDEDRLHQLIEHNKKEASDYLCLNFKIEFEKNKNELSEKLCLRPSLEHLIRVAETLSEHYPSLNKVIEKMKSDMCSIKFYL